MKTTHENIDVLLHPGPLAAAAAMHAPECGAVMSFEGIVRPREDGRPLAGLRYEIYEPMTSRHLERLAQCILEQHGLIALRVEHSHGFVPVGEVSFRLQLASAHRAEGLAAMDRFITDLKRDVPIWKVPCWENHGDY